MALINSRWKGFGLCDFISKVLGRVFGVNPAGTLMPLLNPAGVSKTLKRVDDGRVAQIGSGKIFGSVGFVRKWIDAMAFSARRTVAHAVGDVSYSSHGWRLAKRRAESTAS